MNSEACIVPRPDKTASLCKNARPDLSQAKMNPSISFTSAVARSSLQSVGRVGNASRQACCAIRYLYPLLLHQVAVHPS